jgi:pyruvate-formate lyase-activating enzyme
MEENHNRDPAGPLSRAELQEHLTGDAWHDNIILNGWEYATKAIELESLPPSVCLPIADSCNARCEFCLSWLMKGAWLDTTVLDRLSEPLRTAAFIDLAGYGEPLAHPDFSGVINKLEGYIDQRCRLVLFTNGALLSRWIDRLLDLNVSAVAISLNAATAETHDAVMGLGPKVFDHVVSGIRTLRETAGRRGKLMTISLSLVVTQTNIHEVADFVRLCGTLPIDMAYLRTLQLGEGHAPLNRTSLPPYLHPQFEQHRQNAIDAIAAATIPIHGSPGTWHLQLLSDDLERRARTGGEPIKTRAEIARSNTLADGGVTGWSGPPESVTAASGRKAPFPCAYVYQYLLVARTQITPCCFMHAPPGHEPIVFDGSKPFREIWNGPQMQFIRRTLRDGPLIPNCHVCTSQGAGRI